MPTEFDLEYQLSPQFRIVLADSTNITILSAGIGDRLIVSFNRLDYVPLKEQALRQDDSSVITITNASPEMKHVKTVEFSVDLRPDVAFAMANTILRSLENLSPARRALYGIPDNLWSGASVKPTYPPA